MALSVWRQLTLLGLSVEEIAAWSTIGAAAPPGRIARIVAAGFTPEQFGAGDTADLDDDALDTMARALSLATRT